MKFYYGNSYKEAISNPPIIIRGAKQLLQYQEQYTFVIPAEDVENEEGDYSLFLYANPDEDNEISEEITCVVLDEYLQEHKIYFDDITLKKEYLKKAERLVKPLTKLLAKTNLVDGLKKKGIDYVEFVVEEVDGPVVKSWIIWKGDK